MKALSFIVISTLASSCLFGQKSESKDYKKMKEEMTEKIFGAPDPYFKENKLPDAYKNESAVILAQKHTIESDSKMKFHFSLFMSSNSPKFSFYDIFRRKIYINDQAALKEFSELSFNKLQSKYSGLVGKMKNYTFMNIRLIKPNGTIKNVDVDESAVTLKDEKTEKTNKIAIPDLSIGDVIDYYIASYYEEDAGAARGTLNYIFADDYPILTYAISLQFDARIAVLYENINGAPDFKKRPDDDGGGNVLTAVINNIPKIKGLMWSSMCRQIPIIRLEYTRGSFVIKGMPDVTAGNVSKIPPRYFEVIEADLAGHVSGVCDDLGRATIVYRDYKEKARKAWKEYTAKHPRADNPDSLASFVYRFINWNDNFTTFDLQTAYNNAYYPLDIDRQVYKISEFAYLMKGEFKTDIDLVVVPGRDSYAQENVFKMGDLSLLIKTHDGKPQYFSFEDNFGYDNMVPYNLQGQQGRVFPFDTKQLIGGKLMEVSTRESTLITLPTTAYKDNSEFESITVKLDPSDPSSINVSRKLISKGYLKKDEQAALTIYEEMALETGKTVEQTDDLLTENKSRSRSQRNPEDELRSLLDKARTKHKEDFENEIERNYDVRAKQVNSFKILNFGTTIGTPFEFEEEFVMDGWLKKAGNNYIMDLGKLITSQLEIKGDQRERSKDIYMPFARSFGYHIEFIIPDGYSAEGVDKLNMNVENETGAFTSKAKVDGNKIVVDISKYYVNSFEQAAKWPALLSFVDKAFEFNQQKVLIKKI